MRLSLNLLILVCVLAAAALVGADSIWKRAERESGNEPQSLFADRKASKVGDVVTVIVAETATASSKAETTTSKEDKVSGGPGVGSGIFTLLRNLELFKAETKSSDAASGKTTRSGLLTTTVTALVTEVTRGGNLFIEGTRELEINNEKQTISISGIVRPEDIGPANTVYSTDIAEAKIEFTGKGTVGDRQRKGLLRTLLDWLF